MLPLRAWRFLPAEPGSPSQPARQSRPATSFCPSRALPGSRRAGPARDHQRPPLPRARRSLGPSPRGVEERSPRPDRAPGGLSGGAGRRARRIVPSRRRPRPRSPARVRTLCAAGHRAPPPPQGQSRRPPMSPGPQRPAKGECPATTGGVRETGAPLVPAARPLPSPIRARVSGSSSPGSHHETLQGLVSGQLSPHSCVPRSWGLQPRGGPGPGVWAGSQVVCLFVLWPPCRCPGLHGSNLSLGPTRGPSWSLAT